MKTGKKILSMFLVVLMVLMSVPLSGFVDLDWPKLDLGVKASAAELAESGSCGENVTYTFNSSTGLLTISGTGAMADYSYNNWSPFKNSDIESVVIEDGVTNIGNSVFSGCTSLTSVTIPSSVTSIGSDAFRGCTSLTSITIPDSVISIGYGAFGGCTSLTSITIGNGVTSIGYRMFEGCTSLTSITIPDSVTDIGSRAFYGCTSLTSITISDSVTRIGSCAFEGCAGLTCIIIPDSITYIGGHAFKGCTSLTSITIPDSVTSIGNSAFEGCNSLISVIISDSVTDIGRRAFYGCTSLTSITISDSVTSIGDCTFYNTGYYNNESNWEDDVLYIGKYLIEAKDSITSYDIKEGTLYIADSAFQSCTSLTSVTIGSSVTSIGDYAFYDCKALTEVTIPDSVTSIGSYAFYVCKALTEVTIPDSVTSIGCGAFAGCTSLTSITIPDSVTNMHYGSFIGCTSLTSVTIGNGVTSIYREMFRDCISLTSVTIPDSVTRIEYLAFDGCDSLTDVYYNGTKEDWNAISIDDCNDPLLNATIHFISDDPSHTHTPKTITISASCTVDGMTYQVCSECGEPIGTPTVIPAAHTPGDWEVDIEPTYEAEGKEVIKCTVCHKILETKPIPKLVKPVITDENTGIKVEYNDSSYDGSVDMTVTETFDGSAYQLIDTIGATSTKIYDITITVDGEETQPNGKVTVKIPLPAGYNPDHSYVYHVNTETGAVEKMSARYEDGYMVFETDHFSYYAVIEIHEHTFSGSKCTTCGYDKADSCSCNCHASGIAHFFFVIVNFFQKLFGNNKVCDCGASH